MVAPLPGSAVALGKASGLRDRFAPSSTPIGVLRSMVRSGDAQNLQRRIDSRRVPGCLIHDQVRNDARIRIDDVAGLAVIGIRQVRCIRPAHLNFVIALVIAVERIGQAREWGATRSQVLLSRQQIVVAAVDRPKARGHQGGILGGHAINLLDGLDRRHTSGMKLGDLDLLQDELKVVNIDMETRLHGYPLP